MINGKRREWPTNRRMGKVPLRSVEIDYYNRNLERMKTGGVVLKRMVKIAVNLPVESTRKGGVIGERA